MTAYPASGSVEIVDQSSVVEVSAPGPQGATGPQGEQGPINAASQVIATQFFI